MKRKLKVGDVVVINNPKSYWTTLYYRERVHCEIGVVESINSSRIGVRHRFPPPPWLPVNYLNGSRSWKFSYTKSELIKIGVL